MNEYLLNFHEEIDYDLQNGVIGQQQEGGGDEYSLSYYAPLALSIGIPAS